MFCDGSILFTVFVDYLVESNAESPFADDGIQFACCYHQHDRSSP